MTEKITGIVRRVFFSNPDKPAMAGAMEGSGGKNIRFAGKCFAAVGDKITLTGDWVEDPKFGKQFKATDGVVQIDESPEALVTLLASHPEFKGIGPARAKAIVAAAQEIGNEFGDGEAMSALLASTERVAALSGVKLNIVEDAAKIWRQKKEYFDSLAILAGQGWSNAQGQKIITRLGSNAPAMVATNPYMLIGKVARMGFRTVDAVALKMGIKSSDPLRLGAGVSYCLDAIADNGNTWTTREGLLDAAFQELRPDTINGEDLVRKAIQGLVDSGLVHVDKSPNGNEIVADAKLATAEIDVFDRLLRGLTTKTVPLVPRGGASQGLVETLNKGQRAAFDGFSRNQVAVISGSAGSGKTYTMDAIATVAEENGLRVALCAPSATAAQKLGRATEREASTIHRLLEYRREDFTGAFVATRCARNLIEADLVIVDEFSMVDIRLVRSLLLALPDGCRLLLVGDHNQIPSVGPGAILRDVLSAQVRYPDSVHVLTDVVRQAGILARNTAAILSGVVVAEECPSWGLQKTEKGNEKGAAAMAAVVAEMIVTSPEPLEPFGRHLELTWDVQVLAPMRKGSLGTYALNTHFQKLRQRLLGNPVPDPVPEGRAPKPLLGDRVIWTQNDYKLQLFNGTQAIVMEILKGGAMKLFIEDGREVTITARQRVYLEVAYAMTIHKAQGSEWPCVILVASGAHHFMHDRNLFYTGASRASESLTILGDWRGMTHFAKQKKSEARQTFGSFIVHGWSPIASTLDVVGLPEPSGQA